jgi:hypothetical protein
LDLLNLCNLLETSNILHHDSYTNVGLQARERLDMIQGRVWAREVLGWLFDNYDLEGGISLRRIYWINLSRQMRSLCLAKRRVEWRGIFSFNGEPNGRLVKEAIERTFAGVEEFWEAWDAHHGDETIGQLALPCYDDDDDGLEPKGGEGDYDSQNRLRYARHLWWALGSADERVVKRASGSGCGSLGEY